MALRWPEAPQAQGGEAVGIAQIPADIAGIDQGADGAFRGAGAVEDDRRAG